MTSVRGRWCGWPGPDVGMKTYHLPSKIEVRRELPKSYHLFALLPSETSV